MDQRRSNKGRNTRIYELAKRLRISNKELIRKLNQYGVQVKSHMSSIDEETLENEYLVAMDWDLKTAKPSKKKLLELGLEDVASELWP